jgi:hypothetical protein
VAGAAVLPWLATAALGLSATGDDASTRRWRAAWRTGLAAGLLVSFVPPAWLVIVLLVLFAAVVGAARGRTRELAVVVLVPLVLVLPWAVATLAAPGAWLVEAGRAGAIPADAGLRDLLLGRTGGPGEAPEWLMAGLPLAGLAAFIRRDTRARVLQVWVVILAAAIVLATESRVPVSLPGVPVEFRPWPGFLLLLIHGGFALAAVIAADGAIDVVRAESFSWRQPVAAVSGGLDSANGFGGASAPGRRSRAWVVQEPTSLASLSHDRSQLRPAWVLANLLGLVTTIVLAAPERRRRR